MLQGTLNRVRSIFVAIMILLGLVMIATYFLLGRDQFVALFSRSTEPGVREPTLIDPRSGAPDPNGSAIVRLAPVPKLAPPTLTIEPNVLRQNGLAMDTRVSTVVALPGVSIGTAVGGGSVTRRTLRLWSVTANGAPEFQLANILRPPLGDGRIGSVNTIAVSPDANLVAGAVIRFDRGTPVYVFHRNDGRLAASLTGLPSVATALAFSPDGKHLAVGLTQGGLRIFRTADWTELRRDPNYTEIVRSIAFAPDGRMATTSFDGQVRLYDSQFLLLRAALAPQGARPFDVAFSPDGTQLAVGYYDKAAVSVLDANTLTSRRVLVAPAPSREGDWLTEVAWARDGSRLFAAGFVTQGNGRNPVLSFDMASEGPAQFLDGLRLETPLTDLLPYNETGVVAVSDASDPDDAVNASGLIMGAFSGARTLVARFDGERSAVRLGSLAGDIEAFRVSDDGLILEVPASNRTLRLDLTQRRGDLVDTASLDLKPPRLTTPAFEVLDWRGRKVLETAATENGQVTRNQIALDLEERALSLAYAPGDEPYFVLGTNFAIRKYAFRGSLLQTIAVPAGVQRLSVTPDGRLYVAVLGDGTIRWYDAARGRELFAVYVSPKDQRWIGWTPNGRYDGSPGSDELLGWQINRGPDREPLFYSAQVFGSLFYTTDLGARVLRSLEIPDAPNPATLLARLAPVVELSGDPQVANGKLTVKFEIKAPSGRPITGLRATINGVAAEVDTSEGPVPADTLIQLTFDLPPGAETNRSFSLSASHDDNVYGDAAERGFQVVGRDAPQQDEFKQERLLGLVVGISDYRDPGIPDLRFGERDATEVTAAFQRQLSRFYKQVDLQTLVGTQATRANIINALESIRRKRPSTLDTVLLFFAGHGVPDPNNPAGGAQAGRYFFVTHDANYSGGELAATAFSYTDLYAFIRETEGRQLVFLDTCYSGLVSETGAAVQSFARLPKPDANGIAREAGRLGAYVVAATTGNAVAYEDERLQNGALTFALLEAMDGRANDLPLSENRRITTAGLRLHLESTIKRVTNNRQKPAILDLNTEAVEIAAVVPPNPSFGALIPAPAQ